MAKRKDPKVGTGKKPKGSGRRLYTDENPKDTVSIKFATMADAKATIMGKTAIANLFKQAKSDLRRKHKKNGVSTK